MGQDNKPSETKPQDENEIREDEIREEELESVNGGTAAVKDRAKSATKNAEAVRNLL